MSPSITSLDDSLPVVIIGSGMAGYTLVRELRKLNPTVPIVMVCQDAGASYAKPTLSNAFAQKKLANTIANADVNKMAESLNLTIYNFYHVSHINTDDNTITIHPVLANDKQQILPYRDLVLATGAHSRSLPNLTIDQQTIFAVNHLDDYVTFQQAVHRLITEKTEPVKIAIIGAGLIGCEFANDLISLNGIENGQQIDVTIFDKAQLPLAVQLPSQASLLVQATLQQAGVNFCLSTEIVSIAHTAQAMVNIEFLQHNMHQHFEADIVLVAIGLVANTQLAEAANIEIATPDRLTEQSTLLPRTAKQGIMVNQYLQTSVPHIYALGDCANVMGSYMPYVMPLMNQAKALAKTLANTDITPTAVNYPAMPVAIKTPSLPLVVLPVTAQYPDEQIQWQTTQTTDGMIMTAHPLNDSDNSDAVLGFVLVGKEAGKQRLALSKQVADWLT